MNNYRPRKPWLAGLLTCLAIGLGHFYAGKPQRGIILFLAQGILAACCLALIFHGPPAVILAASLIGGLGYFIFCLLDAIKIAGENKIGYQLQSYNRWYVYLAYWLMASLIIQPAIESGIKKNIVQAYKIPAGSMMPTLLPGDHILVDKWIYKNNEPQRGDIIIFPYPEKPAKSYVKRLIGLEGDKIEIRDKVLYLNGEKYMEDYVVNLDPKILPGSASPRDNLAPVTIPEGRYFVMGDNRDNSFDSRFWKFVKKSKVEGKVRSLYWSWDREEFKIRWSRIGKAIDAS